MTIIEPEVIDKLITDIVSGVVDTSGHVLVGDWLENLYLLGRIASGEELMKKMMLIPTRAGYVYECTNCSGRFDATTCEADNHGC